MSLKRKFCHSIPLLTPAIFETLIEQLEEEEEAERQVRLVDIRCRGVGMPRKFLELDAETGEWRRL